VSADPRAAKGPVESAMPPETLSDISRFFDASRRLSETGVITGPDYTGEIAGYLCSRLLGVQMIPYRDRSGFDGTLDGRRVAVRFTNCAHGRPLAVPDPSTFETFFAVLGPRCTLKPFPGWSLLFYSFPADSLMRICTAGAKGLVMDGASFAGATPLLEVELPARGGREGRP
jgi:hypothetical protein